MGDDEIIETLQLAYRWGYPLMAMSINNTGFYGPTLNAFYNMKMAADANSQHGPGFNAEVLYSAGAMDLRDGPLVLSMPPMGDRFVVFPIQDAWGNIDDVVGTRTFGNDGGNFLISGPDWEGTVPDGMPHFRIRTNVGFVPGRTMVRSAEDAHDFATSAQDRITFTPLGRWGEGEPNTNRDTMRDPLPVDPKAMYNNVLLGMTPDQYFNLLDELLLSNRTYDYDVDVLAKFEPLGIGPGLHFEIDRLGPTVKAAMEEFCRTDAAATAKLFADKGADAELSRLMCRFGDHYWERYYCLFGGLGGNVIDDAIYFWLRDDTDGEKMHGHHSYVVHFEPEQVPHTRAFWSLTLYDKDFYLLKEVPLDRHMLNSSSGMIFGPDGSLDIHLQSESPGAEYEDNWLPSPADTEYFTLLRVYWPEQNFISGEWKPPTPRKV